MTNYGISEAKSRVGFKSYAVPNRALGESKTLRGLLLRGAIFVSAFSMVFSAFVPTNLVLANHGGPYGNTVMKKIVLCHWDASGEDGAYKSSGDVAVEAAINGHDGHDLDIIPPFHYKDGNTTKSYPGKNWDSEKWNEGNCGEEKVIVCHQVGDGVFEKKEFKTLEKAEKHIKDHNGDYLLGDSENCGQVAGCDIQNNAVTTQTSEDCPDPCDELVDRSQLDTALVDNPEAQTNIVIPNPCPPQRVPLTVVKLWQDQQGNNLPAPQNKSEVTISVNGVDCTYDEDELECDEVIYVTPATTLNVSETGLPSIWTTHSGTGSQLLPQDCTANGCTHTVINRLAEPEPCGNELVSNGGFELPEVKNSAKWDIFPSGTPNMDWSVEWVRTSGNEPDIANLELHEGVNNWASHGGDQHTELDSDWQGPNGPSGEDASVKIYQDLITIPGGTYTVSLWTSPRPGQDSNQNRTEVKMGGTVLDTIIENGIGKNQTQWTLHTYTFVANNNISRLEITDVGQGNSFGAFVDDVSVKQECISDVTVCKQDNRQNYLPGWTVMLKGPKAASVKVYPDGNNYSTAVLTSGDYYLEASGTYTYRPGSEGDISDAAYSKRIPSDASIDPSLYAGPYLPWVRVNDFAAPYTGFLGIQVENANFDWGTVYSASHEYSGVYNLGANGALDFRILDDYYGDNSGYLKVEVYPIYSGVTDEKGCVTFQDVPHGTYTLDEILKAGWENVSGKGQKVEIDQAQEYFTLVNKCVGEECKPKDTQLHFIKVVCSEYSDIQGHEAAHKHDDTGGYYTAFWNNNNNTFQPRPLVNGYVNPSEIPGEDDKDRDCYRAKGWQFKLSTDKNQTKDVLIIGPTNEDGEIGVPIKGEGSPLTDAHRKALKNGNLWVSEITQEGYGFGALRCYDDALNGDNLEYIKLGNNKPEHVYCIAYNVKQELPCDPIDAWAAKVELFEQGKRKNGTDVLPERSDSSKALGAAQNNDTENFVSLGFGGNIVLSFGGKFVNTLGPDIKLVETSYGAPSDANYPEKVKVEVAMNLGGPWTDLGEFFQDEDVEMGAVSEAMYMRLTDVSNKNSNKFNGETDGYDVDGVRVKLLDCEEPEPKVADITVCKEDQYGQKLPGWTVMLVGSQVADLSLDSAAQSGVNSGVTLASGETYLVKVNGTWDNRPGESVDAEYVTSDAWVNYTSGPEGGFDSRLLEVQVDTAFVNWGPYSNSHDYSLVYTGTGNQANFRVFDGDVDSNTQYPDWYNDNKGLLDIEIFEAIVGITQDNGCVTLDDVPYGSYTLDEILQDGWINIDGRGDTVVVEGYENPSYTLVNSDGEVSGCTDYPTDRDVSVIQSIANYIYQPRDECFDIRGLVYNDQNSNYDHDSSEESTEPGLPNWTVNLYSYNAEAESLLPGNYLASDTTDEFGNYEFLNLYPGCYIVEEVVESGWEQTEPGNPESTDYLYYVALGGYTCPFIEDESESLGFDFFGLVKTAHAEYASNYVYTDSDAIGLDFGNSECKDCGGSSSTSSSGSRTVPDDDGRVLGDSTGLPYQAPQVLGEATELPRTGTPLALAFSVLGILAIVMIPRYAKVSVK